VRRQVEYSPVTKMNERNKRKCEHCDLFNNDHRLESNTGDRLPYDD
jgi:hypothetical protein